MSSRRMKCLLVVPLMVAVTTCCEAAECHVVGDSIAYRASRFLRECSAIAQGGLTSTQILERAPQLSDDVVISAGTNDPQNPKLADNLAAVRSKMTGRVIWILPAVTQARVVVEQVARAHGDHTIAFRPGDDGRHPDSPRELAEAVRAELRSVR